MSTVLNILWHCASLGLEWKLTISIPVATAEFFKFGAYWVQHLTTSSFRIWNSSAGIPSPPLALFMGMLSKAHLTSNSKMSGSSWVITLLWLSESFRAFVYSSSVYSYHFLISSASIKSMPFLSFIVLMFAWNVPFVSLIFLKRSLVFPFYCFLLFLWIDCLMRAFLSLLAVLWNSTLRWEYLFFSPLPLASLLFSAICKASTDCHFAFLNFFFLQIDEESVETVADFIFLGSKITADGDCSLEIKRGLLLGMKVMTNLERILKIRNSTLLTKVHLVKAVVFPVVMYECESWTIKKAERRRIDAFELWCWRRLESPLDCKEIQPVHSKGHQSWVFIGRTDIEVETPVLWSPDVKSWLIWKDPDPGKDWGQEEKGMTEDEMVGWHHRLNGHGFGWTPGVGNGQGGLACWGSWGWTWLREWTELN